MTSNDKPKWKCSEFWVQVVVMIMTLAVMSGLIEPGTGMDKGISLIVLALSTFGYNYARTTIKKAQLKTRMQKDKPGYKTSEYWFTAVGVVSSAVVASGAVEGSEVDKVLGLITAGLSSMGYAPMRANLKTHTPKLILFFFVFSIGCTAPSLKAIQSRYKAIAPEYVQAVHDTTKLTQPEKDTRYLTVETWRIDAELPSNAWGVKKILANLAEYRFTKKD